jgi:ketosteroid isomerase-like protein
MSENLDLVRSIYTDWELGDFTRTDWADSEIEFVIADGPDPRSVKDVAAMAAGWREFLTAWTGYGVEADEYLELSDARVLVGLHATGQGKTSGVQLGQTSEKGGANLHEIRGGKLTRLAIYFDRDHALADLGLTE